MSETFSKNLTLFIFLSFLSLSLMLLDRLSLLGWLREGVEKVVNPIRWEISRPLKAFQFQKKSLQESVILQAKLDHLEQERALLEVELKNLREENEALKKQLKVAPAVKENLLLAKNLGVLEGIMVVDKGKKAGVSEGQTVSLEGILVGCLIGTTPLTSRVSLPIQEGNRLKVKILPSGEKGFLKGTAEGRLILEEVLQKVELAPEQLVVTSGEEGKYPPDLPIGKIEKIFQDDIQIYQKAEVKPLVDYSNLPVVMIRM